jgi:fatty acid desaturase
MESEIGQVCIPNISTRERRKRLLAGLVMLALSLAASAALVVARINPWWRLALFPLFAGATLGYFQWRDKT